MWFLFELKVFEIVVLQTHCFNVYNIYEFKEVTDLTTFVNILIDVRAMIA